MSDRAYPDTVTATVDGRTYKGCGGASEAMAIELDGTSWKIAEISGVGAAEGQIRFAAGRITGRACNRFDGTYRMSGRQLIAGAITSTRMACEGPRMATEIALLAALQAPVHVIVHHDALIELVAVNGRRIRLQAA